MDATTKQPLTNVQLELLKIFAYQLPENELADLKLNLATFFSQKLVQNADSYWQKNNMSNDKVDLLLNTKFRNSKVKN